MGKLLLGLFSAVKMSLVHFTIRMLPIKPENVLSSALITLANRGYTLEEIHELLATTFELVKNLIKIKNQMKGEDG